GRRTRGLRFRQTVLWCVPRTTPIGRSGRGDPGKPGTAPALPCTQVIDPLDRLVEHDFQTKTLPDQEIQRRHRRPALARTPPMVVVSQCPHARATILVIR